jgi:hypothetical protein
MSGFDKGFAMRWLPQEVGARLWQLHSRIETKLQSTYSMMSAVLLLLHLVLLWRRADLRFCCVHLALLPLISMVLLWKRIRAMCPSSCVRLIGLPSCVTSVLLKPLIRQNSLGLLCDGVTTPEFHPMTHAVRGVRLLREVMQKVSVLVPAQFTSTFHLGNL